LTPLRVVQAQRRLRSRCSAGHEGGASWPAAFAAASRVAVAAALLIVSGVSSKLLLALEGSFCWLLCASLQPQRYL